MLHDHCVFAVELFLEKIPMIEAYNALGVLQISDCCNLQLFLQFPTFFLMSSSTATLNDKCVCFKDFFENHVLDCGMVLCRPICKFVQLHQ